MKNLLAILDSVTIISSVVVANVAVTFKFKGLAEK
ncbi:hypothetical protein SCULI_v1c01140 [Spiroplasma culicicola AES-1]|uniref:Uncharacterized protein n=1 Tax=Spiroplasma culicicola AES-1 TaxID=1276246 RepID=W6A6G8_9MOLU|nr:hypothetical protein SCULI_v1c01140 [Spiroplasma culicicola AES-1]